MALAQAQGVQTGPKAGAGRSRPRALAQRAGPAPLASLEDLSFDLDESSCLLPPVGEGSEVEGGDLHDDMATLRDDINTATTTVVMTPATPATPSQATPSQSASGASSQSRTHTELQAGCLGVGLHSGGTPRIDISRASSSSQHDDSSPERELTAGGDPQGSGKLLGFMEEGAEELRSSTEELRFTEEPGTVEDQEARRRANRQRQREAEGGAERKDSACSADVAFLSISGRTSRLSSVGSAASGCSGASNLSSVSRQSGASRSPSPAKMLLETSFCGTKGAAQAQQAVVINRDRESKRSKRTVERQAALEGDKPPVPKHADDTPAAQEDRETEARKIAARRAEDVRRAQSAAPTHKNRPPDEEIRRADEIDTEKIIPLRGDPQEEERKDHPVKKVVRTEPKREENRKEEKREKRSVSASKTKKEDALVRIIPLHSEDDEEIIEEFEDAAPKRVFEGLDDKEDLEVQRRRWLETHVSREEDPELVRIIPLRSNSTENPEKPVERTTASRQLQSSPSARPEQTSPKRQAPEKVTPIKSDKVIPSKSPPKSAVVIPSKVHRSPEKSAEPQRPSDDPPKLPGKPRGPRRKVDPNALVRIIPLKSEDSYEGYGEDDLPPPQIEINPNDDILKLSDVPPTQRGELLRRRDDSPKIKAELPKPSDEPPKSKDEPPKSAEHAKPNAESLKLPGKPRGPRRKVDPNVLVRIIPLKSEDSYEGYGEDDLPPPEPPKPKCEGVDTIVDEIDMSKWREPSFEESDLVRIIPLKVDAEQLRKEQERKKLEDQQRCFQEFKSRSGAKSKPREKDPDVDNDLVRIIPLHGSDEEEEREREREREKEQTRQIKLPKKHEDVPSPRSKPIARPTDDDLVKIISLHGDDGPEREIRSGRSSRSKDRSPVSPRPPSAADDIVRIIHIHGDPEDAPFLDIRKPTHPIRIDAKRKLSGDELVRIIPLHSPEDSGSEAELAGYATRTGSRLASRPGSSRSIRSVRSEHIEPLQIVPLDDPESVNEKDVAFTRRDLAIQSRGPSSQHSTPARPRPTTPQDNKVDLRTAEQALNQMLAGDSHELQKPATPATLDLNQAGRSNKKGQSLSRTSSPKHKRKESIESRGDASRTPSPPPSTSRKSSLSSIFFRRTEAASPESPAGQRRISSILRDPRTKSRDRVQEQQQQHQQQQHKQQPLSGPSPTPSTDSVQLRRSGRDSSSSKDGRESGASVGSAGSAKSGSGKPPSAPKEKPKEHSKGGVFSGLFRKKETPQPEVQTEPEVLPPEPVLPEADSQQHPIEGLEFTFTCEATFQIQESALPSESVSIPMHHSLCSPMSAADPFPPPPASPQDMTTASASQVKKSPSSTKDPKDSHQDPSVDSNANPSANDEERISSGSDRDVDEAISAIIDHERKGLVLQQDSFEDELPYVPTTLPMERSVAIPLVPVKQRISEVKTIPIDRPRSTTPINPSSLEDYVVPSQGGGGRPSRGPGREKLKISLPREDSLTRRTRPQSRPWADFASQALQPRGESPPPPPLPPRAQTQVPPATPPPNWINFEELPEKRRTPVRIQTIPARGPIVSDAGQRPAPPASTSEEGQSTSAHYVDPEHCRCECHGDHEHHKHHHDDEGPSRPPRTRPFGMDLDVSSNRSSVVSQFEHSSPEGPE